MSTSIMLPYTIKAGISSNDSPRVIFGLGTNKQAFIPNTPVDDSYWWYFFDNATLKLVYSAVVPGANNSTVPSGIDTYMNNPSLLFGIATQYLSLLHVPQGALYDYVASYGAGDALKALEQLNVTLGCGYYGRVSYVLVGQAGPRGGPYPPPPSYEEGSYRDPAILQVSLMSLPNGQPPYSVIDEYTFR
ncbi:MAG: hypothetical protein ABSE86_32250 [Bryobacteraceae bacterium]